MKKIAVYSAKPYDRESLEATAENKSIDFHFFEHRLSEFSVRSSKGFDGICIFVNDVANREVLTKLDKYGIRVLVLRCAGFNNVDLEAAKELGIKVFRVPAYSPEAVAEHAVALLMTVNRRTHRAYNRVREGNFELNGLLGMDIHGKSVGVVGTGLIGKALCRIMNGFGCKVYAYDPYPDESLDAEYIPLNDLFEQSDIVSLHCPLTEESHHLIDRDVLDRMKHGAILINTGRGGLVDTRAVIEALKTGSLGALGLDVYEEESDLFFEDRSSEIIKDDTIIRLMGFPNVLITGHQGFFTTEALGQIADVTTENLDRFFSGLEPKKGREVQA